MDKNIVLVVHGRWVVDQEGRVVRKLDKKRERISCLEKEEATELFAREDVPEAWRIFGEICFGGLHDSFMNWSGWDRAVYNETLNGWLPGSQRTLIAGGSPAIVICHDKSIGQTDSQPATERAETDVAA